MQAIQQILSLSGIKPAGAPNQAKGTNAGFLDVLGKAGRNYNEMQQESGNESGKDAPESRMEAEASLDHIITTLKKAFSVTAEASDSSPAAEELQAKLEKLSSSQSGLSAEEIAEQVNKLFQTYDSSFLENELHVFFEQQNVQEQGAEVNWQKTDVEALQIQEAAVYDAADAVENNSKVKPELVISAVTALVIRNRAVETAASHPEAALLQQIHHLHQQSETAAEDQTTKAEPEGRLIVEQAAKELPALKNHPILKEAALITPALEKAVSNLEKAVAAGAEPAVVKKALSGLASELDVLKAVLNDTTMKAAIPSGQELLKNGSPASVRLPELLKGSPPPGTAADEKRTDTVKAPVLVVKELGAEANRKTTEGYKVITDPIRFVQLLSEAGSSGPVLPEKPGAAQVETGISPAAVSRTDGGAELQQVLTKPAVESGAIPQAQQVLIQLGEAKTAHGRQQEFIKQFQEILNRSSLQAFKNGTQQLTLILRPAHLGRIDMKILMKDGVMTAQLTASSKGAREIMEQNLPSLRQSFASQQLQVERIDITEQQESLLKEKEEQEEKRRLFKHIQPEPDSEESAFSDVLEDILFNEKV
ncbi:flagellar hook-length control protein FliK [Sinobaca qinghaiensis]|uniref:Flagellar hook-length control protein FliK n=1 Tax=Sinobaca qinghaiensis TaxID=342944 RepID=A0A419V5Z6_9BACL|nr:flagellar hook-length control protein FliK [Sinobaca qinghaiensis]RKD75368.1 flagellar hook-length control protein FliK [Sinobaca qinghaiensis]